MIVHDEAKMDVFLLFTMRGSIVPAIVPQLIIAGLIAIIANVLEHQFQEDNEASLDYAPFTSLGVGASIFLGFRNNACYDRWWEARKQWGKQLIVVRNLSRLLCAHDTNGFGWVVLRLAMAQTHALRALLRPATSETANEDRDRFLTQGQKNQLFLFHSPNVPESVLRLAYIEVRELFQQGLIDNYSRIALTNCLDQLGEVQGACERISNTPLPFPYSLLVRRTAYLYILLAPFAMAAVMGWWAIPFNMIVAYTFFGLDELACQLEHPFKNRPHCLALDTICRSIEMIVMDTMSEQIPVPLKPIKHLLM
eukprot:m.141408 g.141408  ORF g.141408 m.141408 type:complete len:309 (-) comp30187_c0_seq1:368-1294(-)